MLFGLNPYQAHYRPAFACSLIPCPTPRRLALRLTVPTRGNAGFTRFRCCAIGWLRSRLSAGGIAVCDRENEEPLSQPRAFWLKPVSVFGLLVLTTFIDGSHLFSIPSTLAPDRFDASSHGLSSRFGRRFSMQQGYIIPRT